MRAFISFIGIAAVFAASSVMAGDDDNTPPYAAMGYCRVCKGDPRTTAADKAIEVLWEGMLQPAGEFRVPYQQGISRRGGSTKIPGEKYYTHSHGDLLEYMLFEVSETHVKAQFRFDCCDPIESGSPDFIATSGRSIQAIGNFTAGKPHRFFFERRADDDATWAEIVFEIGKVQSSLSASDAKKKRAWWPTWKAPSIGRGL